MPIITITLHKMKMVNENESTLQNKNINRGFDFNYHVLLNF